MSSKEKIGGQKALRSEIADTGLCTGCGACVGLCPYHTAYEDRIVVLHRCDLESGRCYAYCPRTVRAEADLRDQFVDSGTWRDEIGTVRGFYMTRAADPEIRRQGQHGGTVTALVKLALSEGFLDAAVLTDTGNNFLPQPVVIRDPEKVRDLGGSRFVVSPVLSLVNECLTNMADSRVGVVATPCQALALARMRFQTHPDDGRDLGKLKLVIGLFCGWALSWKPLLALMTARSVGRIILGMDIPPSRYHVLEAYTPEGTTTVSIDEVTPCVREACRTCEDMTAEYGDLSVGSARLPEGWEEARKWNQLIVRTEHGQELLELARRKGVLEFREMPEGNLERLKLAASGKKQTASRARAAKGKTP